MVTIGKSVVANVDFGFLEFLQQNLLSSMFVFFLMPD